MMEFERQSEIMDMKEEMMSDAIDDAMGDEDDEEERWVSIWDSRRNERGGGQLIFKGEYDARTRKQVKRVVFVRQWMYVLTLKRVSRTVRFRSIGKKDICFSNLEIVIRV